MISTEIHQHSINNKIYWSVYSTHGHIYHHISNYIIHCVDNIGLEKDTVRARAYTLRNWVEFLNANNTDLLGANDSLLILYRNQRLNDSNANSSNSTASRKRSINQYLRYIYFFYKWIQDNNYAKLIIGPTKAFRFKSFLSESGNFSIKEKFPCFFDRTSSKSKHRKTFTPSNEQFLSLYNYFLQFNERETALRNCLILKLARDIGFRVDSIASLTINNFHRKDILESKDTFSITPARQKFGRQASFKMSIELAMDVADYIEDVRSKIALKFRSSSDEVFLSSTNGKPLKSKSISSAFSKASKKIGMPYRSGIHSWRGLFTEEFVIDEINIRKEEGLDISIDSIAKATAEALGQANINSQQSYIRSQLLKHDASATYKYKLQIAEIRAQLQLYMEKCAELERFCINNIPDE